MLVLLHNIRVFIIDYQIVLRMLLYCILIKCKEKDVNLASNVVSNILNHWRQTLILIVL